MLAFLVFAVEHSADHGNKTAFYVAGLLLAGFAVAMGGIGAMRPSFASTEGASRALIGTTVVLAVATLAAAFVTAS